MATPNYRDLLARETARYGRGPVTGRSGTESARDAAVRAANIAAGYGNSTALRKPAPAPRKAAAAPAAKGSGGSKAKPDGKARTSSTNKQPMLAKGPDDPNADMRTPTSATSFYPTQSPTSVPGMPTISPTSVPQATRSPTSQPGFYPPGFGDNPVPMNPMLSQAASLRPVPPELLGNPTVPMNPALSQASVLRTLPPDLRSRQSLWIPKVNVNGGFPEPTPGAAGTPTAGYDVPGTVFGNRPLIDRGGYSLPRF